MNHQDLPILQRLKAEDAALTRTEQTDPGGTLWNFDRSMIPLAIAEIERLYSSCQAYKDTIMVLENEVAGLEERIYRHDKAWSKA